MLLEIGMKIEKNAFVDAKNLVLTSNLCYRSLKQYMISIASYEVLVWLSSYSKQKLDAKLQF